MNNTCQDSHGCTCTDNDIQELDLPPLEINTEQEYIDAIERRDKLFDETDDIDRVLCHIVSGIEIYEQANRDSGVIARLWEKLSKNKDE